jgi:hypothetical protein
MSKGAEEVLARQLTMNAETWSQLVALGVSDETPLVLDFTYIAPSENAAKALSSHLMSETDYRVEVRPTKAGLLGRRSWEVAGSTIAQPMSLEIVDMWVRWMVAAGFANAGCEFDGWGTSVPQDDGELTL